MIKQHEDTTYLCLFGRRYVFKDHAYIGWYHP